LFIFIIKIELLMRQNIVDLKLSNNEYYDFHLVGGDITQNCCDENAIDSCLVTWFDFNNKKTFNDSELINNIYSLSTWSGATNSGYTFDTFGLTGLDNGELLYDKDINDIKNVKLVNLLTGSTLTIEPNDKRLILHNVSGSTQQFIYPIELKENPDPWGTAIKFCGGFYQGYYKIDGSTYQVLPTRTNKAWVADFWINKEESCTGTTNGTTLNDKYPNNKGFFFYMGTRAENKFWNIFEGNNTGCTINCEKPSGCNDNITQFCTELKETDIQLFDKKTGFDIFLNPPLLDTKVIKNQFLIYGRASQSSDRCGGCGEPRDNSAFGEKRVCNFTGDSITISDYVRKKTDNRNQFLIYGRANKITQPTSGSTSNCVRCNSCGKPKDGINYGKETVCSYSGDSEIVLELDKDADIYDNAIGFRVTDDGRVGYRALKYYCSGGTTGVTVEEQYSMSGEVKSNEWTRITIRYVSDKYYSDDELECSPQRKGKLMIYVNCKLKAIFKNVDEFIARRLNEFEGKQVGVPFNISLGGGSQGLLEHMTFDGQDISDLGLLIEKNFAGTFIGQMSEFKFHICDMNWCEIKVGCDTKCNSDVVFQYVKPLPRGIYYGKLIAKSFEVDEFSKLTFSARNEAIKSSISFGDESLSYNYFLIPKDFKQPTNIKNSSKGCLGFDIPYLILGETEITFEDGQKQTFVVYRTVFMTRGILDVWFCE
jgi:hypothetical protein